MLVGHVQVPLPDLGNLSQDLEGLRLWGTLNAPIPAIVEPLGA